MKKFYEKFCKFEENLALWLLAGLTILVFVSAMMRTFGFPLNWAQDADRKLADYILIDIIIGGNFGQKNADRSHESLLVSSKNEKNLDSHKKSLLRSWHISVIIISKRLSRLATALRSMVCGSNIEDVMAKWW